MEEGALSIDEGANTNNIRPSNTRTLSSNMDNDSRTTTHSNHSGSSNNSSRDELVAHESQVDANTVEVTVDTALMAQANAAAAAAAAVAANKGSVANALGRGMLLATTKTHSKNRVLSGKAKGIGRPKLALPPAASGAASPGGLASPKGSIASPSPKKSPVRKRSISKKSKTHATKPKRAKPLPPPSISPQRASARRKSTVMYADDSDDEAFNNFIENPATPEPLEDDLILPDIPPTATLAKPSTKRKGRTPKKATKPGRQQKNPRTMSPALADSSSEKVDEMIQVPKHEFDRLVRVDKAYQKIKKLIV